MGSVLLTAEIAADLLGYPVVATMRDSTDPATKQGTHCAVLPDPVRAALWWNSTHPSLPSVASAAEQIENWGPREVLVKHAGGRNIGITEAYSLMR